MESLSNRLPQRKHKVPKQAKQVHPRAQISAAMVMLYFDSREQNLA